MRLPLVCPVLVGVCKENREQQGQITLAHAQYKQRARIATIDGPDPVDVHVGQRIRLRRQLADMSQEQLAKAVGVSFQQIQKYERGLNRVSASRLYDVARVQGVQIGFYFEDMGAEVTEERPAASGDSFGALPSTEDEATKTQSLKLLRAFWRLRDDAVRDALLDLVEGMAKR